MNSEIIRLNLSRGNWQAMTKELLPGVTDVTCAYPDAKTMCMNIFENKKTVARFALSFLDGCKGILVSHSMLVSPEFRGKGIAKKLQSIKEKIAKDLQVSVLLATVTQDNLAEKKVIKDWKCVDKFNNKRTGNNVEVFTKKI
jgi:GNAT superfamily N-acetyltransferase